MQCPQCEARTEVTEKRGPFRARRCTNLDCGIEFTTREHVIPQQERNFCARTRAIKIGSTSSIPPVEVASAEAAGCRREEAQREPPAEASA
jgi:endogenous inhibitor of DNA gyrase (YacG/DUF329 family)